MNFEKEFRHLGRDIGRFFFNRTKLPFYHIFGSANRFFQGTVRIIYCGGIFDVQSEFPAGSYWQNGPDDIYGSIQRNVFPIAECRLPAVLPAVPKTLK